ncbi:MAG: 5-formyltetrahydrofolate cyclo-ligase [Candidatus Schekmanbacteria bacterium RIFCSPHIGHO2_02_FULL_38_11]|uniref:5-formyltetrahydrofolate cyclo-ligase n=1 Tax=Candidatus Schekmanbacteria bacterium RIFCSPLOWO2_12_FULL_38_15 TaxID=1817883 RepID=A0A1F7SN19_9BACT|nr:MAG: 5-formyltetrahydrofolate cyclo-ligase [Candidatus Schekmanbacteria bacterium GWA2_38_9]OGL48708.1 MAG: 5-formyltetrahydrofolate cyclo-ligase [Candidatus Schekmanbacteria bacterium RIFCSPHIGHO2_02_FULL_38_11]OGL51190.1 MAG: 5-formyltetrahydrofolate cyclo-ligase [Candidatus Schekmanbacteria bacterium RIFCSPLOWO2_02_FULL_38_14]OGL55169.1 MAG: 5-formyltetrahydrofolate cyclo-ligase [Candidatus Schekmanbacteria bacterium RIFCSPLOWO2_12_FULL_38_15]
MLFRRERLSEKTSSFFSKAIVEKINNLREFKDAKTIFCYISKGKEVCTEDIIKKSIYMNKKIIAPRVDVHKDKIVLHEIKSLKNDLSAGFKGILEPKLHLPTLNNIRNINFAIIPGIAFDRNGRRIGFGKGFFDKLLSKKNLYPVLCGIAFDFQIIDDIPYFSHDICMDIIVSEKRIIRC